MTEPHSGAAMTSPQAVRPAQAEAVVPTAARMRSAGERLAGLLRAGDLVVVSGPLGAGKTTLVQGIGAGLAVRGPITSPTFVIARIHPALRGGPDLVHADAYRLGSRAEVDDLDLDADTDRSVTVVEWGEGLVEDLAPGYLHITLRPAPPPQPAGPASPTAGSASPGAEPADLVDPAGGTAVPEPGDEARLVTVTGHGDRWACAAEAIRQALAGHP